MRDALPPTDRTPVGTAEAAILGHRLLSKNTDMTRADTKLSCVVRDVAAR